MPARPVRAAPVLQVADVAASAQWYRDRLGFEIGGMWGEPPAFAIVGRGPVTIFLDASRAGADAPLPLNQHWAAYVYVDDMAALIEEMKHRDAEILRGPEDAPYGCREIDVRDRDGHMICFAQDLQPGPEGPGL
ncbi:MAG: VOC family protein [Alphaproteobacteria bacterium]